MDTKIQKMSSYKAQVLKYGVPISKEKYLELSNYANDNQVKLSGFKNFVGDIDIIKQVIDDITIIAKDFPLIIHNKRGIILELDYNMGIDYATTESQHIIRLNAVFFSNIEMLKDDYNESVNNNRFVKDTSWHSIIRHEIGHVVANLYHLKPLDIAKNVLNITKTVQVLDILTDELSIYSTEYEDGREIISEAFSGYYSNVGNEFADKYVSQCISIVKEGGV